MTLAYVSKNQQQEEAVLPAWRELERARRRAHPELRGVSWRCEHEEHDPMDTRGRKMPTRYVRMRAPRSGGAA